MKVELEPGAYMPEYAHPEDAGMDIRTPRAVTVEARSNVIVHTGVHVEIPKGCAGKICSKSGLNVFHDIITDGLIDEGYTGEIVVKVYNLGDAAYSFREGDKITQLVIAPVEHVETEEVESLYESAARGSRGLGSTGR